MTSRSDTTENSTAEPSILSQLRADIVAMRAIGEQMETKQRAFLEGIEIRLDRIGGDVHSLRAQFSSLGEAIGPKLAVLTRQLDKLDLELTGVIHAVRGINQAHEARTKTKVALAALPKKRRKT